MIVAAILLLACAIPLFAQADGDEGDPLRGLIPVLPDMPREEQPAAIRAGVSPFAGYIDYHQSQFKKHAWLSGVYAYLGIGTDHLFEAEVDHLDRVNVGIDNLSQWDYTLVYSNYALRDWRLRLGGHLVDTNEPFTDGAWVLIAGADYYHAAAWSLGLDFYLARYERLPTDLTAFEIAPHWSVELWRGDAGRLVNTLYGYYIHLSDDAGLGNRDWLSIENRISLEHGRLTASVFGWAGRQAFAVRNEGFLLFNLPEKHVGGFGVELMYRLTTNVALSVRTSGEFFTELGSRRETMATTVTGGVSVSF